MTPRGVYVRVPGLFAASHWSVAWCLLFCQIRLLYDSDSADLAWQRTIEFFRRNLV
jgi:dienelactone hydrolase